MKVLLNANSSWYLLNFRKNIIKAMLLKNYDVFCMAPRDEYTEELKSLGVKFLEVNFDRQSKNIFKEMLLLFKFYKAVRRVSPNFLINFTVKNNLYGTIVAAYIGKIRIINNITGLGSEFISKSLASKIIKYLYSLIKNFPHHTYFQNHDDANFFVSNHMVNIARYSILPGSGVDCSFFHPRFMHKGSNHEFRFIFLGRLIADKGIIELIKSIKKLNFNYPHAKLTILGMIDHENPSKLSLDKINEYCKDDFIDLVINKNNVRDYLSNSDCFVLPSYREGLPKAALEAMAMGLPIILSNVTGCKELLIEGFNGTYCEAKSEESLNLAMERMIRKRKSTLLKMGKKSRELIEKSYSEDIVISDLLNRLE